jgi:hypothetical protein
VTTAEKAAAWDALQAEVAKEEPPKSICCEAKIIDDEGLYCSLCGEGQAQEHAAITRERMKGALRLARMREVLAELVHINHSMDRVLVAQIIERGRQLVLDSAPASDVLEKVVKALQGPSPMRAVAEALRLFGAQP